ncbi:DUF4328 domain-containing protein [Streptomyces fructofermentans]|uniref:DUF4328 domain-containing protein n=1 Tax=Streptomyces fructofermentans TaxID=152141 RepID=UPI0033EE0320
MLRGSGAVTCLALGVNIVMAFTLLASRVHLYHVLGITPGGEPALRASMWVQNLSGGQSAVVAATGVLFVGWFSEVGRNAAALGTLSRWKGDKWTMGAWAVPAVNLVLPLVIALHIWVSSPFPDRARRRSRLWVVAWWSLFVAWALTDGWARNLYEQATAAEPLRAALRAGMLSDLLCVPAAVAAIAFVRHLARAQGHRAPDGPSTGPARPAAPTAT